MSSSDVTIRECVSVEDFQQCIQLERAIWKDADIDIMPIRLYMISKTCNAPTIGAFDSQGRLVGFGHTSLALVDNHVAYHSHMLGVLEQYRDKDIGYRIKLFQRQRAIEAGIRLIFWTFDPLVSRNAYFNINKLGAIVKRYEVNYYGEGVSTVFDPDVPSDRLIAEWWVSSPHVESVLAGNKPRVDEPLAWVCIPDDIDEVRARRGQEHRRWRFKVRDQFQKALAQGAIVRGFAREADRHQGCYLFGPDEDQFRF
jgi:predicted GNAT superfamily acetyltransferase